MSDKTYSVVYQGTSKWSNKMYIKLLKIGAILGLISFILIFTYVPNLLNNTNTMTITNETKNLNSKQKSLSSQLQNDRTYIQDEVISRISTSEAKISEIVQSLEDDKIMISDQQDFQTVQILNNNGFPILNKFSDLGGKVSYFSGQSLNNMYDGQPIFKICDVFNNDICLQTGTSTPPTYNKTTSSIGLFSGESLTSFGIQGLQSNTICFNINIYSYGSAFSGLFRFGFAKAAPNVGICTINGGITVCDGGTSNYNPLLFPLTTNVSHPISGCVSLDFRFATDINSFADKNTFTASFNSDSQNFLTEVQIQSTLNYYPSTFVAGNDGNRFDILDLVVYPRRLSWYEKVAVMNKLSTNVGFPMIQYLHDKEPSFNLTSFIYSDRFGIMHSYLGYIFDGVNYFIAISSNTNKPTVIQTKDFSSFSDVSSTYQSNYFNNSGITSSTSINSNIFVYNFIQDQNLFFVNVSYSQYILTTQSIWNTNSYITIGRQSSVICKVLNNVLYIVHLEKNGNLTLLSTTFQVGQNQINLQTTLIFSILTRYSTCTSSNILDMIQFTDRFKFSVSCLQISDVRPSFFTYNLNGTYFYDTPILNTPEILTGMTWINETNILIYTKQTISTYEYAN